MATKVTKISYEAIPITLVLMFLLNELNANNYCKLQTNISPCPEGWTLTPGKRTCILRILDRLSFKEARDTCAKSNADLLVIFNKRMNEFVREYINETQFQTIWLDLTDRKLEGVWHWKDGNTYRRSHNPGWDWEKGRPKHDKTRNCAIRVQASGKLIDQNCDERHFFYCQYKKGHDEYCRERWATLPRGNKCFRSPNLNLSFNQARDKCKENGTGLMIFRYPIEATHFKFYLIHTWIGLIKRPRGLDMYWLTGEKLADEDSMVLPVSRAWETEPEACAHIYSTDHWDVSPCSYHKGVVCQKEVRDEPGNTEIHFHYHRPDRSLFEDQPLEVLCLSDNTNGPVSWSISQKNGSIDFVTDNIITDFVLVKNREDVCINRTVSKLTINAVSDLDGAELSCFSQAPKARVKCRTISTALKPCSIASPFTKLLDGPKAAPILTIVYDDTPGKGEIKENQKLTARCTASVGVVGVLTWVVFFLKGPRVIPNDYGEKVTEYFTFMDPKHDSNTTESVLEFKMRRHLSGVSIACFSYDVHQYTNNLDCLESNVYCAKSAPIRITKTDHEVHSAMSNLSYVLIVFFLVFAAAAVATGTNDKGEAEGSNDIQSLENIFPI